MDEEDKRAGSFNDQSPLVLFPDAYVTQSQPKKLKLNKKTNSDEGYEIEGIPRLILPTRWEHLQPKIERNDVSLRTIIRPVYEAMDVVRDIVEYLKTTSGCQVLVIRADTGSGKTTFLNTLPSYMQDVEFHTQTIDIQSLNEDDFGPELRKSETYQTGINLIILEGREKPESIPDKYIQVVLANINRFARIRRVPLFFVIPTVEEQVARSWCDHATKIGDLIPEQQLYEGSRWYNFPGVAKDKYIEIVEETVRALNPPYNLVEFGISSDEVKAWADTAPTIGRFIEILANKISARRKAARLISKGKREHVWIIYCNPDLRHYDHTYLVIDGLVQDETFRASPAKLVPSNSDTPFSKNWRQTANWSKLVATINFLDIRLLNFPIIIAVTAALTYGDDDLLQTFKKARLKDYEAEIPDEMKMGQISWDQPLAERRLQILNARDSIGRSNLFLLLRGMPAEQQKGGNLESINVLAQYLHLRKHSTESDIHYFIGRALEDLLQYHQFPGLIGVETEEPLISGQMAPVPDITIHTETDIYALEFHFLKKQTASSEVTRYAIHNVIDKYMKTLPHLNSILQAVIS